MGFGSYNSSDWEKLRKQRNINDSSVLNDLYKATSLNPYYDPKGKDRESRDSKDNPVSTPIIFGLDVTGSMGYLSTEIAKEHLNKTMIDLYDKKPVIGPQILFAAIDDCGYGGYAPLQVTQFESDIRIAQQLLDLWFVGMGGGNGGESYNLLWYFAAKHTKTDCDEKRHEKGFLFTIGDEPTHPTLFKEDIEWVFGDSVQNDYTSKELLEEVRKRYNTYHIITAARTEYDPENKWKDLIGKEHVVVLERDEVRYLSEVIVSMIRIASGENKKDVIQSYEGDVVDILTKVLVKFKR